MSFESNVILRDVFFRLSRGDRVGLIGKNGSGKTTLLKLILGQAEPDEGTVAIDQGLEIGYFSQFSELDGESNLLDVLHEVSAPIHAVEAELKDVEVAFEQGPSGKELDRLLHHQAFLFQEMERLDGWNCAQRMETVLTQLGFNDEHRQRPINQLSGGWCNRAALAKILLQGPSVLLMDEPTNFLDIAGLTWLEEWFRKLPGALIVVSHDRHFLDQVVNKVIEVENHQLQEYQGGFSEYVGEKQRRFKTLERQFEHEEALLAHEALAIEKRQRADSRKHKRRLANIKKRKVPRPVDKIITEIYRGLSVPKVLCSVEGVNKAYDTQTVLRDVSFELHQRHRLAVLGPNGCGKTTLLRVLTDNEQRDSGTIEWGLRGNLEFAFYNSILEELDLTDTVSHAVNVFRMALTASRKVVTRFLSLMQFSEMDLKQKIGTLSGGQRARVALAKCLLSGAPVIIMDEPTNHLDLTSTQVMERALVHFPGSVVVVSHDRFFIDKVATRLLVFGPGGETRTVNGNWTQWQGRRAAA